MLAYVSIFFLPFSKNSLPSVLTVHQADRQTHTVSFFITLFPDFTSEVDVIHSFSVQLPSASHISIPKLTMHPITFLAFVWNMDSTV